MLTPVVLCVRVVACGCGRMRSQEVERCLASALALGPERGAAEAADLLVPGCLALGEAQEFLDRRAQAIAT